jgi:hypothetical protein
LKTLQVKVTEVSCIKKAGSRSDLVGVEYKDNMEQADDYRLHFSVRRRMETITYRHDIGGEVSVYFKLDLLALRGLSVPTYKNINY